MTKDKIRQLGIVLATFVMISGYALSNAFPKNVNTINEVSEKFSVYFVPATYTFLIWGVIFLGLIAYSIYQALPAQKENASLRNIGWWYVGGSLSLLAWTIFWHFQQYIFMMVMMVGVLVSLLSIYEKLRTGLETETRGMRFLVQIPFSIFLGWITMASIANISQFLAISGWNGFGISTKIWTVVMIVVALVIAELTAFNQQDLAYLAVIIWSFIGIAVKNVGVSPVFEASSVAAGIVFFITVITLIVKPKLKKQQ